MNCAWTDFYIKWKIVLEGFGNLCGEDFLALSLYHISTIQALIWRERKKKHNYLLFQWLKPSLMLRSI